LDGFGLAYPVLTCGFWISTEPETQPMKTAELALNQENFLVIDSQGAILEATAPGSDALGWTREELVAKSVNDLFEYGADLLLSHLEPLQAAGAGANFSVSALIRKSDLSHVPATAIVRALAEAGRFGVGFEDLPVATEIKAVGVSEIPTREILAAAMPPLFPETESLDVAESNPARSIRVAPSGPAPTSAASEKHEASATNGEGPRFRNVYLAGAQRPAPPGSALSEMTAQLEAERKERRRLEARALSLNDQLQQLHGQLKSSLESENIYQKRVADCEESVRKAELAKSENETAMREEREKRERVERESADFSAAQIEAEAERKSWEQRWLAKIESSLGALQESDTRLAKEIETRREIAQSLAALKGEFVARSSGEKQSAA
jgi:hypothetical protein